MAIEMDVDVDASSVILSLDALEENIRVSATNIVKQAAREVRTLAVAEVHGVINCSRAEIRKRVLFSKTKRHGKRSASAFVYLKGRPLIPSKRFRPKQTESGVAIQHHRSGGAILIRSAFGPKIRRLGKNVFRRKGTARLPIEKVGDLNLRQDPVAQSALMQVRREVPEILREKAQKAADLSIRKAEEKKRLQEESDALSFGDLL